MTTTTKEWFNVDGGEITPSPAARLLFGQMVARADRDLVLTLDNTLELAVVRGRAGKAIQAEVEMSELLKAGWIERHPLGGWSLYEEVGELGRRY